MTGEENSANQQKRKERSDETDEATAREVKPKLNSANDDDDDDDVYVDVFGNEDDDDGEEEEEEVNGEVFGDEEAANYEGTTNRLIREDTAELHLNGGRYTFHFQLLEFLGGAEGVKEIHAKVYFSTKLNDADDDDENEEEVGYLTAFLLPRPVTDQSSFHDMADSVSDELAELAGMFCNRRGHVTKIPTGLQEKEIEEGGLLQLYSMEVKGPGHAGKCDLGLHLVHETFEFLKDEWNIAIMVPLLLGVHIQQWPDFHNRLKIDPNALHHSSEQTEGLKEAHMKIKRHYARMGFVQAGRNSEHHHAWYLTATSYYGSGERDGEKAKSRWKSKADVKDLDIFVAPDTHNPSGVDADLNALVVGEPVDKDMVRDLVQKKKASIHRSRALFVAAADNDVELLQVLVEELGGDINEADENGNTPLHVAAMMLCAESIAFLTRNGANKNARNDKGQTPLHTAQDSVKALDDEDHDQQEDSDEAENEERENQETCLELLA